ncbi:MAG TPA: protease pro-enzyme activation domain-containing protein [Steroidobacteraceae bacterium]|nr:protease pro-enzyme activation domain-containing protein [Steroidobacteraceae bacterium]
MRPPRGYSFVKGSAHPQPEGHRKLEPIPHDHLVSVTLILRRRPTGPRMRAVEDFAVGPKPLPAPVSRARFARAHGADPRDLRAVGRFAKEHGLKVVRSHAARRCVVLEGRAASVNEAFAVRLHRYGFAGGTYRSHDGRSSVPRALAKIVEAVVGLTDRQVPAKHYAERLQESGDPQDTRSLTPQLVERLYDFPPGNGEGQTIGLYEMRTGDGPAGYALRDIEQSMAAFGGGLKVPKLIDVAVDGVANSGQSDGETGLDITVAGAVAQEATIAVYFTGGSVQAIIHALQRMIHPDRGDPGPTILSVSYGWGPDDGSSAGFSASEYTQLGKLFQDAAALSITVLVSSGDTGAFIQSPTGAQTSYPATEPWVIACGGTTIGDVQGTSFEEYAWNDRSAGSAHAPGATGGGISARFSVPEYQSSTQLPRNRVTGKTGRGIPDVAANASENSGYVQYVQGQQALIGGTSAVAPLYAGLIARINANLGRPVGFINSALYRLAGRAFRDIAGPSGPQNNSFGRVVGYPVEVGWDACTGLGSVRGIALQNGLTDAIAGRIPAKGALRRLPSGRRHRKVFTQGTFRGVDVRDPFAVAALQETPVRAPLGAVPWPRGLAPRPVALGRYKPGQKITGPLEAKADFLLVLYTDPETQALLEVFTGNEAWSPARKRTWNGYAHNFAKYRSMIANAGGDLALAQGIMGYLSAVTIDGKTVVLYKSELHPKQNGDQLPFIPVMQQLLTELQPACVISTGTAGAIGSKLDCGDVAITKAARFHLQHAYPDFPQIGQMSASHAELTSTAQVNTRYVEYAAAHLTALSLPGLARCHAQLQEKSGFGFVRDSTAAPAIYVAGANPVPGPEPMAIVSADYLTVDDSHDTEGLEAAGIMNDTDDAFLFYAISKLAGTKPVWLSIRNASEPQIVLSPHPRGSSEAAVARQLGRVAGRIYGIYQYSTTLNSAFACWGVVAGA